MNISITNVATVFNASDNVIFGNEPLSEMPKSQSQNLE